jgi:release factor glutamine methyltransferase
LTGKQQMSNSIRSAITEGARALDAAGVNEARKEAASLMGYALGSDRTFVIAHAEDELSELHLQSFRRLITRRAQREPLQYLTGHQEFFNLDFEVTPDVLIPRAETEIIVEAALDVCRDVRTPFIADIGTGSGCIVVSLLHELSHARAIATDLSLNALRVAQRNAKQHNVNDRLTLVQADGFAPARDGHQFSLIVSNPPYVTEHEFVELQPEVRDYEPRTALVSGEDGLSHIRQLLHGAPAHLQRSGYFIFEIGFGQNDAVAGLIDQELWSVIEVRKDLQNIPRTFVLQKR